MGRIENDRQLLSMTIASLGLIQVRLEVMIRAFTSGKSNLYDWKRGFVDYCVRFHGFET